MENRFGIRDLIHVALLLAVIVVICVTMYQIDRQWEAMVDTRDQMARQADFAAQMFKEQKAQAANPQILELREELEKLRQTLERGVVVNAGQNGTSPAQSTESPAAEDGIRWLPAVGRDVDPFERHKAAAAMEGYQRGDYLVDVFAVIPEKLTPLISSDVYGTIIQGEVLESLARRNPDTLEWQPLIARWWRISEDGLTMEFELRSNVVFSDGKPLTADDVVFSFEMIMNPAIEAPRARAYYEKVKSVTKLSPTRVRFTFNESYFKSFEIAAGMEILPKHFYEKFTPEQFNRSTGLLMGSGPYRLSNPESWKPEPGKPIEVVRNELYWGPAAPFDRILWRVIPQDSTRLTAFGNGEIDKLYPTPEQYNQLIKDENILKKTLHFQYASPTAGYLYVGWYQVKDGKPTIFADKRVRQAMTMLINRQMICDNIFLGLATPVTGPFSPLSKQYDHGIEPWPFDITRAKALLAEAGFTDRNNDRMLDKPDGSPLTIKLTYPSGSDTFNRVVLAIKDDFAKAGILLETDPLEWNVLIDRMTKRQLEACSLGWSGNLEGDPYQIFHSDQLKEGGDNNISYSNDQLDKLIVEARGLVDEEKRMALWKQVHQILHEDQPYTFLMTRKSLVFADKRFQNVQLLKTGPSPETEWFVPMAQRKWVKP